MLLSSELCDLSSVIFSLTPETWTLKPYPVLYLDPFFDFPARLLPPVPCPPRHALCPMRFALGHHCSTRIASTGCILAATKAG